MATKTETQKVRDLLAARQESPVIEARPSRLEFAPGIKNGTQIQVVESDRTVRWVGVLWDVAA